MADTRQGYKANFLSVSVPIPRPKRRTGLEELKYHHFSVLLDTERKLAVVTGVNISGGSLIRPPRNDNWRFDDRVDEKFQAGPEVYESRDIDRGHLVRRLDPVWGPRALALEANDDTFCFPNAAPQAAGFNQGKALWAGLEDHVLDYADAHDIKISVFTAPVFGPNDPLHKGVRVPRLFWKIATWTSEPTTQLRAAGFILDQSVQLDRIALEPAAELPRALFPDLAGFRTFQVPISTIAESTGLPLGQLVAADRYQPAPPAEGERGLWQSLWKPLTSSAQIDL